jgi:hypothetical protein
MSQEEAFAFDSGKAVLREAYTQTHQTQKIDKKSFYQV